MYLEISKYKCLCLFFLERALQMRKGTFEKVKGKGKGYRFSCDIVLLLYVLVF